jgi:hypothetical protein
MCRGKGGRGRFDSLQIHLWEPRATLAQTFAGFRQGGIWDFEVQHQNRLQFES